MSGIVDFIIKLQDELSGPLDKVTRNAGTTNGALTKLTESNKQLKSMVGQTSHTLGDLKSRMNSLKEFRELLPTSATKQIRSVNDELAKLNNQMSELESSGGSGRVSSWFKDAFSGLPALAKNPLVLIGAGLGASLNQGMKNSKDKLDLQLLVGDNSGELLFKGLKGMKPMLGDGAFSGGKELIQAGVSVDKILPMISQLGDVSLGSTDKLAALTASFSMLNKEGKLSESTLESLQSAGFKPLDILHQKTGESMKSLQKKLEDGKISIKMVEDALQSATGPGGQFFGVMDKIANSPSGAWEMLKFQVVDFAGKVGDKLMPLATIITDVLIVGFNWLTDSIGTVVGWMSQLYSWTQKNSDIIAALGIAVLTGVTAYQLFVTWQKLAWMWQMRDLVATTLLTTAKGIATLVTGGLTAAVMSLNAAFWANPFGIVIGLIAGLIAVVMVAWDRFESFRTVLYGVWEATKEVFGGIGEFVSEVMEGVWGVMKGVFNPANWFDDSFSFSDQLSKITNAANKYGERVGIGFQKGKEKGAASWAEREKNGTFLDNILGKPGDKGTGTDSATAAHFGDQSKADYYKQNGAGSKPGANVSDGINAVSGGGVKNITITIGKMIEQLTIHVAGGNREAATEMERIVEEQMLRAIASASGR
jgi:tape measure domain-containing protein